MGNDDTLVLGRATSRSEAHGAETPLSLVVTQHLDASELRAHLLPSRGPLLVVEGESASVLHVHFNAVLSAQIPPHVSVDPVREATQRLRPAVDICGNQRGTWIVWPYLISLKRKKDHVTCVMLEQKLMDDKGRCELCHLW